MNIRKFPKARGSIIAATVALLAVGLAACSGNPTATPTATNTPSAGPTATNTPSGGMAMDPCPTMGVKTLNGAGSSFDNPLFTSAFQAYDQLCGVQVNYQSVGSGAGISALQNETVDFGASDGIMTAEQKAAAKGGEVIHLPVTAGAVPITYNLSGIPSGKLKLTGQVLADIYAKKITKWNDPAITALNPGLSFPSTDITVVHRSDGSGTTFIFSSYLASVSSSWKSQFGGGSTTINWVGDVGGKGNDGVSAQVAQIPGAIGYVELAYAITNNLPWATLQNSSGNYIEPSQESAAAAANVSNLPDNMEVVVVNSSNSQAYPIVGFSWMLLYVNQTDAAKADALVHMAWWLIHDGQQYGQPLHYAALSGAATTKAEAELERINVNGSSVIK